MVSSHAMGTKRSRLKKTKRAIKLIYQGEDCENLNLSELDGSRQMTAEQKIATVCALSLMEYQIRNNTNVIPRLLRTTAVIRKP